MSEPAVLANGTAVMDPQQDREDSTEGSGESEEAAEAPSTDDAASAGPYAQAALQSLLAYDTAIAQQVSEIAAEQRAVPGAYRESDVMCRRIHIVLMCITMPVAMLYSLLCGLACRCNSRRCQHICA